MAPEVRALAQSESKSKFMERLGLDERIPDHKHLYHMMKVSMSTRQTLSLDKESSDKASRKRPALGVTGSWRHRIFFGITAYNTPNPLSAILRSARRPRIGKF
jgi:2-polyprenyl-6-methoxyphenol hydroxylase-like FAD-dependent oxidoreductase